MSEEVAQCDHDTVRLPGPAHWKMGDHTKEARCEKCGAKFPVSVRITRAGGNAAA
jgi:hypothetical protein